MSLILMVAIAITLLTSVCIVVRWRNLTCEGSMPVSPFAFYAILFTSGLDVGLIMFPLTEFPLYEQDAAYNFANPLAVEFGFWGFLVWAFYFLTTFYFCVVEPHVKLIEIPIIRFLNNLVVIATCAFTGYLFLSYLPTYISNISARFQYGLVAIVVLFAVLFWWFAWSIMIGQFVSRFLGKQKTWQLLIALLVIPSIPIALWFSVLYFHHTQAIEISGIVKLCMVTVGVVFVINSLDSLIRLYTVNLKLTANRIGKRAYIIGNWATMFGLVLLYQFTPFKIEWVGLIVIGIYAAVYVLLFDRRKTLLALNR